MAGGAHPLTAVACPPARSSTASVDPVILVLLVAVTLLVLGLTAALVVTGSLRHEAHRTREAITVDAEAAQWTSQPADLPDDVHR